MPTTAYAVTITPPVAGGFYVPVEVRFEHAAAPAAEPNPNPAYLVRDGSTPLQGRTLISDVTTFYFVATTAVLLSTWAGGDDQSKQPVTPAAYATPTAVALGPTSSGTPSADLSSRYLAHMRLPTGAIQSTYPRTAPGSNIASLTSGVQFFVGIDLFAGQSITSITFVSGATAAGTPLNQWFSLYDASRNKLAVTADDTTTAWAANTAKTLTVASGPCVVPTSGLYYVGIMVKATTTPSLIALNGSYSSTVWGLAPILSGTDNTNTGLSVPSGAPAAAAALSINDRIPYAYVS